MYRVKVQSCKNVAANKCNKNIWPNCSCVQAKFTLAGYSNRAKIYSIEIYLCHLDNSFMSDVDVKKMDN